MTAVHALEMLPRLLLVMDRAKTRLQVTPRNLGFPLCGPQRL